MNYLFMHITGEEKKFDSTMNAFIYLELFIFLFLKNSNRFVD